MNVVIKDHLGELLNADVSILQIKAEKQTRISSFFLTCWLVALFLSFTKQVYEVGNIRL